jgi:hypothetical protein
MKLSNSTISLNSSINKTNIKTKILNNNSKSITSFPVNFIFKNKENQENYK